MGATQHDVWTPHFTLDVIPERDAVRIAPSGEVDMATIETVGQRADELLASGFRRLIVDLRSVTFLDSSGLRLILDLAATSRSDGWELAVIEGSRDVQRVFELTGVRGLVPFMDVAETRHARWSRA